MKEGFEEVFLGFYDIRLEVETKSHICWNVRLSLVLIQTVADVHAERIAAMDQPPEVTALFETITKGGILN